MARQRKAGEQINLEIEGKADRTMAQNRLNTPQKDDEMYEETE
jgi:hypothetical protein